MSIFHSFERSVAWMHSQELVAYPLALRAMNRWALEIATEQAQERVWLLEHPPLYTAGTSAQKQDVLCGDLPVFDSGRGGQMTYHGPGQRVAYLMLDLRHRGQDLRKYIFDLEEWLILTLKFLNVSSGRREGRVGIWVDDPARGEAKIAAIGVRVQKWVTLHGIALNVAPNLNHFKGIVPCGLAQFGVTSLQALGVTKSLQEVDTYLAKAFEMIFKQQIVWRPVPNLEALEG